MEGPREKTQTARYSDCLKEDVGLEMEDLKMAMTDRALKPVLLFKINVDLKHSIFPLLCTE